MLSSLLTAVVSIRLEMKDYEVNEDAGSVELCVEIVSPVVDCPVHFPFELVIVASDITAGIFETVLKITCIVYCKLTLHPS